MGKLGLPDIKIEFQTAGITAIKNSEKGTVALILRDTVKSPNTFKITNVTQIPEGLTVANKAYIERYLFTRLLTDCFRRRICSGNCCL